MKEDLENRKFTNYHDEYKLYDLNYIMLGSFDTDVLKSFIKQTYEGSVHWGKINFLNHIVDLALEDKVID